MEKKKINKINRLLDLIRIELGKPRVQSNINFKNIHWSEQSLFIVDQLEI